MVIIAMLIVLLIEQLVGISSAVRADLALFEVAGLSGRILVVLL
jgi:hypothetical protein